MVKQINLSNYYLRKSEIDRIFGITSSSDTNTITALKDIIDEKSKVSVSQTKQSGIEIAKITIDDGTPIPLYQQDNNNTYTASSTVPPKDTTQGTQGVSIQYARADHAHPKSDLYAEAEHDHDGTYLKSYTPPNGSTSQAGIVKLNTSTNSASTTEAATPSAVKSAYDLANGKLSLTGGILTGAVSSNSNITTSGTLQGAIIKKTNGTSSQFLKADGSIDSNTYLTTSINAGYVDDDFIMCFGDSRNLSITASKECIQANETVTLVGFSDTATSLDFYKGDTKIGTSSVIDNCAAFTYTGDGSGVLNFSVKDGRFQSERFVITDAMFYDIGTSGTPNSEWWKTSQLSLSSDNTGITASNSTSTTYYLAPNKPNTSKSSLSDLVEWDDFICEFTYHEATSSSGLMLETRDSNGNLNQRSLSLMSLTDGDIVKIVYTDNTLKYYKNDVQNGSDYTNCSGDVMIRFAITNNSLRFSNFKVYPI